jgi:hypothetical protein
MLTMELLFPIQPDGNLGAGPLQTMADFSLQGWNEMHREEYINRDGKIRAKFILFKN